MGRRSHSKKTGMPMNTGSRKAARQPARASTAPDRSGKVATPDVQNGSAAANLTHTFLPAEVVRHQRIIQRLQRRHRQSLTGTPEHQPSIVGGKKAHERADGAQCHAAQKNGPAPQPIFQHPEQGDNACPRQRIHGDHQAQLHRREREFSSDKRQQRHDQRVAEGCRNTPEHKWTAPFPVTAEHPECRQQAWNRSSIATPRP